MWIDDSRAEGGGDRLGLSFEGQKSEGGEGWKGIVPGNWTSEAVRHELLAVFVPSNAL